MFILVRNLSAAVRNLLSPGQGAIVTPTACNYKQFLPAYPEEPHLSSTQSYETWMNQKEVTGSLRNTFLINTTVQKRWGEPTLGKERIQVAEQKAVKLRYKITKCLVCMTKARVRRLSI